MARLVGYGVSQVPTNGMLGGMAYQDPTNVSVNILRVGPPGGNFQPGNGNNASLALSGAFTGSYTPSGTLGSLYAKSTLLGIANDAGVTENNSAIIGFSCLNNSGFNSQAYFGAVSSPESDGDFGRGAVLVWGRRSGGNYAESMRISRTGNVMVGTTSQNSGDSKLLVSGANPNLRIESSSYPNGFSELHFTAPANNGLTTPVRTKIQFAHDTGDVGWSGSLKFFVGGFADTEKVRINNEGELLIGYTSDNGAYKLQVNSQIFATSATIATSDGRYKENVATLDGCVDLVKALRPVSFDWKPQQDITRTDEDGNEVLVREGHNFPDGTQVGFIAQEVQEVLAEKPWLTSVIKENVRPAVTDSEGNELAPKEEFLGIAEGNLIAVLTSALQGAIAKIETLEARLTAAGIE